MRVIPYPSVPLTPPATDDPEGGEEARESAVEAVEAHADPEWLTEALAALQRVAYAHETLTVDEVWSAMAGTDVETHEPRAMGAVMTTGQANGWIHPTDRHRLSRRRVNHRRPVRVWRSLVYDQEVVPPEAPHPITASGLGELLADDDLVSSLTTMAITLSRFRYRAGQRRLRYWLMTCAEGHGYYLISSGPRGITGRSTWTGSCAECGEARMGDLVREIETPDWEAEARERL